MFSELQIVAGFISRQFHYHEGKVTNEHKNYDMLKSTPTTQLISQIVLSGGRTISYEYDKEERITKVVDSVDGTTEYTYDALGQLLTETVNGTEVNTMTYDNYGNIISKNGVSYVYDTVWKDKLIAVGDKTITYDAQGNPINYLGHTLTWEKGRQLKSFDNITYTYNANGIRTSKTVAGIRHDYILEGAKIVRETWGQNSLTPLYDNEDSVCGIIYNYLPYYFLKNQQGDIIAITDNIGNEVAKYSYDAWGACTSAITDMELTCGTDIANINPFRYRGYYFDKEIGMYYLQSRYYDPTIGRFVNGDSAELLTVSGYNQFIYCYNRPIDLEDSSGYVSLNLNKYRSQSWLAKLISKTVKVVTEREKKIAGKNIWWLGIKIAMSTVAGISSKTRSFFSLKKNGKNLSCSIGGISFSSNGTLGLSTSFSLFSTSVEAFVNLSRSCLTFGMSVFHNIKQNGKKVYFGLKLAISISYITLAAMAFIGVVGSIFVPALAPVISKIAYSVAGFVSNPYGLAAGTSAVVMVMRAVA